MPPWPNTPAKNRVRDRCLGDDDVVLELLNLARDGHVNVTGTVLAVGDDEAAEEGGVDLGLELDVLGAGHLLDLLGDHELLLVLELDSGGHGGNLGVSLGAVERLELLGDGVELTDAGLVNEKVEEVGGEGVERSLLAELGEDVLLVLALHGGVGEEGAHGGVGSHVRGEGLDVAVDGVESLGVSARLDEGGGVAASDGASREDDHGATGLSLAHLHSLELSAAAGERDGAGGARDDAGSRDNSGHCAVFLLGSVET